MSEQSIKSILIANRGEIAVRIIRTVSELGWHSVAVYAQDDAQSLHVLSADTAVPLSGIGVAAYLDIASIIQVALDQGCDAVHPGYGFLSENPGFAKACSDAGLIFIGPNVDTLALFGDKAKARGLAKECGVPVLAGVDHAVTEAEATTFFASLPGGSSMVIKAISGGGGRGMRVVTDASQIPEQFRRCQSEALSAFGDDALYVEQWVSQARHIEIQIVGDGQQCSHLFERECTLQRRHQKVLEIAPSPNMPKDLRNKLTQAALAMANSIGYRGLGTFEFLVFEVQDESQFVFMEANPRIQVEHTVTETLLGLDLVYLQLQLGVLGESIDRLALPDQLPSGFAVQARINMETLLADGTVKPSGGALLAFDVPTGQGIRVDSFAYTGYETSPSYDSLLAKLIVHTALGDYTTVLRKTLDALKLFRIEGVDTNISLLMALISHSDVQQNTIHTGFIDQNVKALLLHQEIGLLPEKQDIKKQLTDQWATDEHTLVAPMQGTVLAVETKQGEQVKKGHLLLVLDAMKMEHVITAPTAGTVKSILIQQGDGVKDGQPLLEFEPADDICVEDESLQALDLDYIRPDLQEVLTRHGYGLDENRPSAVAKRHNKGQRTARENIADLCDDNSFVEYGSLVIAAQRRRRSLQDLMENAPGDGMVSGIGQINRALFGEDVSRCVVLTYDYTVMAGTQGIQNHHKKDRLFEVAERTQCPVVLFSEGGGGRPGDTDSLGSSAGLDCLAFYLFGKLSGLVPLVGIASGRNFAGNAALVGCCDVVIATENANIGMGGPAMIEGGGLGIFKPEEVGPAAIQASNGVIDILVKDEAEAVQTAKQYLSYFQGCLQDWQVADQRKLRHAIPENRLRIYDVRTVIQTMVDQGSFLELRKAFGKGMITGFARMEGRPLGIVANNPAFLSGAINADGADKAARFIQLCDGFDIPILFLCDTPGIMVGPEVEETALVRHAARLFVTASNVTVPFFTIVLRKAYGLGAMTMAGGTLKAPVFTVSWPTGEFGAMGLEGAVKLGFKKELASQPDIESQNALFEKMVTELYERGKAVNTATFFEFDDVIDPADSRKWIVAGLQASGKPVKREGKKRPCIDTW